MLVETEIKLALPRGLVDSLKTLPLITRYQHSGWQQVRLYNQYFDSAGLDLDKAGFALRMRRDGNQFIQTLKGRGDSRAGLSVRQEWDWYPSSEQLDLPALIDGAPAVIRETLAGKKLLPLFRNDFERRKVAILWNWRGSPVELELALDVGDVRTRHQRSPICELELELRAGESQGLLAFAIELARQIPLCALDVAKAERGFRLLDPGRAANPPSTGRPPGEVELSIITLLEMLVKRLVMAGEAAVLELRTAADDPLEVARLIERIIDQLPTPVLLRTVWQGLIIELQNLPGHDRTALKYWIEHHPTWGHAALNLRQWLDAQSNDPQATLSARHNSALLALMEQITDEY